MDPDVLTRLRRRYRPLLDPPAESEVETPSDSFVLGEPPPDLPELREDLRREFETRPAALRISVRLGDAVVGVAGREKVFRPVGHAQGESAAPGSLGDSGGATLPGVPAEFRTFPVRCRQCGADFVRLHHGAPALDTCAEHPQPAATR
ncbi:hypothetical protein [Actinoplanes sp. HUAS TT8]|uniref:hypothetical protein n=1 Tax=Actinoplanes sp. HUAS TT8 TaxID=3447453 RepID=UPI003F52890C